MSQVVEATLACSVNPYPPHRACRVCRQRSVSSAQRSALQLHRGAARFDLLKTVPFRGGWAGHLHVLPTDDGLLMGLLDSVVGTHQRAVTVVCGVHPFVLGVFWVIWGGSSGAASLPSEHKGLLKTRLLPSRFPSIASRPSRFRPLRPRRPGVSTAALATCTSSVPSTVPRPSASPPPPSPPPFPPPPSPLPLSSPPSPKDRGHAAAGRLMARDYNMTRWYLRRAATRARLQVDGPRRPARHAFRAPAAAAAPAAA